MSLIKKLGKDYFREKFVGGAFVLNNVVFVVQDVISEASEAVKNVYKRALVEVDEAEAEYNAAESMFYNGNPFDTRETYREFMAQEITENRNPEEWAAQNQKKINAKWLEAKNTLKEKQKILKEKRIAFKIANTERMTSAETKCLCLNLDSGKTEKLPEDCFQNMLMFSCLLNKVYVLPYTNVAGVMITAEDASTARCLKLQKIRAVELSIDDIQARNYGYYIENKRWKFLINQGGIDIKAAIKALKEPTTRAGDVVLLEGNVCTLAKGSHKDAFNLLYYGTAVASLDKEGAVIKIREKLYKSLQDANLAPKL